MNDGQGGYDTPAGYVDPSVAAASAAAAAGYGPADPAAAPAPAPAPAPEYPPGPAQPQPGYPPQGYPAQPQPGYPPQGYPAQPQPGYPPQGYPPQAQPGYPPQPQPGYPPQPQPGYPPQGYPAQPQPGYPPAGSDAPGGVGFVSPSNAGFGYAKEPEAPGQEPPAEAPANSSVHPVTVTKGSDAPAEPSKIKKAIATLSEVSQKPWFIVLSAIVSFILALVSMILVIKGFNKLDNATNDVTNTVNNWERVPLTDFSVVDSSLSCPLGTDEYPTQSWPGAVGGPCVCDRFASFDGRTYSSSISTCSTNQTRAGCDNGPSVGSISIDRWVADKRLCIVRDGAASFANGADRPRLAASVSACPTGYKRCGFGSEEDGAICQVSTAKCPITNFEILSSAPAGSESIALDSSNHLVIYRDETNLLPVVDLSTGFQAQVCVGDSVGRGFAGASPSTGGIRHEGRCGTIDTRWSAAHTQQERTYLGGAWADNQVWCGTTANTDIFPSISVSSCADSICTSNADLTRCQKLRLYDGSTASEDTWGLMLRQEIPWSPSCPTPKADLVDNEEPLKEARDLQRILMIVNIITFVIIAILVPICVIWNACTGDAPCCPGDGQAEKYLLKVAKNGVNVAAKVSRLIPMIISLGFLDKLRHFFQDAAEASCSDALTNDTFEFLGSELNDVYKSNRQSFIIDIFLVLISLVQIALTCRKAKKAGLDLV